MHQHRKITLRLRAEAEEEVVVGAVGHTYQEEGLAVAEGVVTVEGEEGEER